MLSKIFFGLIAAKAIICSPIAEPAVPDIDSTPDTLAEAKARAKIHQDLIAQRASLNQSNWEQLLTANQILLAPPPIDHDFLNFTAEIDPDIKADINKRQACKNVESHRITKTETFLDWDIQMSSVVCAHESDMSCDVSTGRSVYNTVTWTYGLNPTLIKSWLTTAFGVSFTTTYTSDRTNMIRGTVHIGKCGAQVLNPMTTRRYGVVSRGCVGSSQDIGTFMADDRFTSSWTGVSWVAGAVTVCAKTQYAPPVACCLGGCTLH